MPFDRFSLARILLASHESLPVADQATDRACPDEGIGTALDVMARARPGIVFRPRHELCPYRVAFDVSYHSQEMPVVLDGVGVKAFLEEVSAYALAQVDAPGISPMGFSYGPGQGVFSRRDYHEMDVVCH